MSKFRAVFHYFSTVLLSIESVDEEVIFEFLREKSVGLLTFHKY